MKKVDPILRRTTETHAGGGRTQSRVDASGRQTLGEIARRVLDDVTVEERSRIWLALENPRSFLEIDGDLLAQSLTHLVERSIRTNAGQILLSARHDDAGTRLSVLSADSQGGSSNDTDESPTGLGGTLETIAMLGGSLTVRHTSEGHLHACIQIPTRPIGPAVGEASNGDRS